MSILTGVFGLSTIILLGLVFFLSGCTAPKVEHYKEQTPALDIREYFNGKLMAYGTIKDYSGEVVSRFTANIDASWEGNVGTLKEKFVFEDGHEEERNWTLTMQDNVNFIGKAHDVVGEAIGKQLGNSLNMKYTLKRSVNGGSPMNFAMDDWMYLIDDTHLVNQTSMRKFGIEVANLTIGFYKVSE